MSERFACQLIVDPPLDGAWNMAVDEALLESIAESSLPTLRVYRWRRPTLSLGYFQAYEDFRTQFSDQEVDLVRRQSGGGAILHDQEITYSLAVPAGHPLVENAGALYDKVHQGLIRWLNRFASAGTSPWQLLQCDASRANRSGQEAFLCFNRRSIGDVLLVKDVAHHKIVGSAQRRRQSAILQHGSVLWHTSPFTPEVLGFRSSRESTQV